MISNGKSAAYGRTEPDISSNTKKVVFNQAVFSGRKTIPQTSKPGFDTNMAPGQSGAGWTEVFNELRTQLERVIDLPLLNPSIPISTFLSKWLQILPYRRMQCHIIST